MSKQSHNVWDRTTARVVTFANQKGGVAKSTTAEAFAASLTARGFAVLMVDLDAQPGNLSLHVGADKELPGTYELLSLRRSSYESASACVQPTVSFGDVSCANERLDEIDERLNVRVGRELVLRRSLAPLLPRYDFVVIDTPPALQVRTLNGLAAADDVVVPCTADVSSVAGVGELLENVQQLEDLVPSGRIRVAGILVTRYDARNNLDPEMVESVRELAASHGVDMLGPAVRETVGVRKAQRHSVALREFAPRATAAADYEENVTAYLEGLGIADDGDESR